MSKYITENERYIIETMLKDGKKAKEIAERIGKHYTTVYREIKRGTVILREGKFWREVPTYCADVGQRKQEEKGHNKGIKLKIDKDNEVLSYIEDLIKQKRFSAYAVSVMLQRHTDVYLCPQTIYNYINHGVFVTVGRKDLIYNKTKQKKEEKQRRPSLKMLGARSIEERPKEVSKRDSFGHWELDTVYSGRGTSKACLLVFTERFTRFELIRKIKDRTADSVLNAFNAIESNIGKKAFTDIFKTITCDNGLEFTKYKELETSSIDSMRRTFLYFCHAYCSSERASNENQNKLIRKYIPKSADIGKYTDEDIQNIENAINNYPRKLFGGLSSFEYIESLGL